MVGQDLIVPATGRLTIRYFQTKLDLTGFKERSDVIPSLDGPPSGKCGKTSLKSERAKLCSACVDSQQHRDYEVHMLYSAGEEGTVCFVCQHRFC
jgi:hypothetical protein